MNIAKNEVAFLFSRGI